MNSLCKALSFSLKVCSKLKNSSIFVKILLWTYFGMELNEKEKSHNYKSTISVFIASPDAKCLQSPVLKSIFKFRTLIPNIHTSNHWGGGGATMLWNRLGTSRKFKFRIRKIKSSDSQLLSQWATDRKYHQNNKYLFLRC